MAEPIQHERDLELTSDQAISADVISAWVRDSKSRSLQLVMDLDDQQLSVPKLTTINPLLWEIGHAAWFQDNWVLQHAAGQKPIHANGEQLFDSIGIKHEHRWDLPMPSRQYIVEYVQRVRDAILELLDTETLTDKLTYFIKLSVFHEDMHTEAFTYTRQTLAYSEPKFRELARETRSDEQANANNVGGDVGFSGGLFQLGAEPHSGFVFDNEKWTHPVSVQPFAMSRTAVTQQQFADFVDDRGYGRRELWSDPGWQWRQSRNADRPLYWKREGAQWLRRHFRDFVPLEPNHAMIHVNWFEAEAYCRWANRRLPTEIEWEFAASSPTSFAASNDSIQPTKRHYPWGGSSPEPHHANLDWQTIGTVDVGWHGGGDSAKGCRQMIGNVWEWTSTTFDAYPGFVVDPYKDYSRPSFGNCKVLRGGCWATRSRLMRNTWRNYYQPIRRDVFAGFRTCALTD